MARLSLVPWLVILAGLSLSGCLTEGTDEAGDEGNPVDPLSLLSRPIYDDVLAEHLEIPSFDGAVLDSWVFRPDTANTSEKVPVILNYSPYWSNLAPPAATGGDAFSKYLIDYFVPRGYAAALVSARGTGMSEGCFTIGGPTELHDEDVVATFLATREWANGNVTASGKSYDGTMAQGLITTGNPHVKTIVPVAPISELYKYNYFWGVPYLLTGHAFNSYYVAETSVAQMADPFGPRVNAEDETWRRTPTRFCGESAEVQANQYVSLAVGDYTPYWQARNYSALLPEGPLPSVYYIHGLADWNVKPDHMVPWIDELRARGTPVKMWLGDWAHDYPHRDDWNLTMLRWLDHHLKGIDTGILEEPLVQVQDADGVWRDEAEWPPARAERLRLHTSADGSLGSSAGMGTSMYQDAPGGPMATATFTAEPMAQALRLVGEPVFNARVSASGPRATLTVSLAVDGTIVDQGFLDLAHRDGLEQASPMVPGTEYDVAVRFYPQDLVVWPGSTLSVIVSHDSTPGGPVAVAPQPTGALVTLHHGAGTHLSLPVVPADDVAVEDPQPEDLGCWAC